MSDNQFIQFDNNPLLMFGQAKEPGVNKAICELKREIPPIYKDQRNDQQKYNFRGIDDMTAVMNPLLAKYGLSITPMLSSIKQGTISTGSGKLMQHIVISVDWIIEHIDGSRRIARTGGEGMDMGDKSMTKAMTSAYKYMLLQVFCIPSGEKMDVEYYSPDPNEEKQEDREEQYHKNAEADKQSRRESDKKSVDDRRESGDLPPKMDVKKPDQDDQPAYELKGDDHFLRHIEDLKWTKVMQGKIQIGSATKPQLAKLAGMPDDWIDREAREFARAAARYGLAQIDGAEQQLQD